MVADQRRYALFLVVVALAAIKLILLPWLAAQDIGRQNLEVLTRRLERSRWVIDNRAEIIRTEGALREATQRNFARFPIFSNFDQMKLETQIRIGELAKSKGLRSGSFEWFLIGSSERAGLQFARARFQFSGELRSLATFHGELEASYPNMVVREVRIESLPVREFVEYGGGLSAVADFYFKAQGGP